MEHERLLYQSHACEQEVEEAAIQAKECLDKEMGKKRKYKKAYSAQFH